MHPQGKVLTFVKLRQWYIPLDVFAYRTLHKLKVPNVRFHEDFVETLQLLTRKHRLRVKAIPFSDVLDEFLTRFRGEWERNPQRKLSATAGCLRLESKDHDRVRETFPHAEACLRRFFRRWGLSCNCEFSETPTRAKLVVRYAYDKNKQPIIEFLNGGV